MLPPDQQLLIACLLSAIPICYSMTYITKSTIIIALSITISMTMQVLVFSTWALLLWVQQLTIYAICRLFPRHMVGKVAFIESFSVLTIIQVSSMYTSYGLETVDITAIFMMQVFQYISFSYNYQDGEKGNSVNQYTIVELPSLWEYLGYMQFVPSCLVGPVFEFRDYKQYIYRIGAFKSLKGGCSAKAMLKEIKVTVFSVSVYFLLMAFPTSFMLSTEYSDMNFFMQAAYLLISIIGLRFKYYTAWSLGMVSMHATGFTTNPKIDENGKNVDLFDRVIVSNIWDFEMDPSMKKKADGWNIPIQIALKRYIYDRIYQPLENQTPKEKKKLQIAAQQKTLAVSALWHGLYPGYFLAFFHWALILQISQEIFRLEKESEKLRKFRLKFKYAELILINFLLGYFAMCFQLMTWEKISIFFSATLYIPIVITYVANIVIVRLGLFSSKGKRKLKENEKAKVEIKENSKDNNEDEKESIKAK